MELIEFADEVLLEGCWLEATGSGIEILQTDPDQQIYGEEAETGTFSKIQYGNSLQEGREVCRRRWMPPRSALPEPSTSVKERLTGAVAYLRQFTKEGDVSLKIWVPCRKGRQILKIQKKSSFLGPLWNSFAAMEDSPESDGSPTTGAATLPVFERGSDDLLGFIEIADTSQNVNYQPEPEYIDEPDFESIDCWSFQNFSPPTVKAGDDELYQAAIAEILEVLKYVCKAHGLPLALTWAPCAQQGKGGCHHSADNYFRCVSTVDSACFVADREALGFLNACSQQHLSGSQGIVGTALTTNKPSFAVDITAFTKSEYPLSQHARMFGFRSAIAVPLQSIYTGSADFVLEFFFPKDCRGVEEKEQLLNLLSVVIQQDCRSLHLVMDKELEDEAEVPPPAGDTLVKEETEQLGSFALEQTWVSSVREGQHRTISLSFGDQAEEPTEEFKVPTHWDSSMQRGFATDRLFSDYEHLHQSSGPKGSLKGDGDSFSFGGCVSSGGRKTGEKKRAKKIEKTISLPVLRQYFAGSLKDAAKSIGVCPTTLKKICRQHGISRWPSRKIKKVGHSLKKLQLVIDSVHGVEGSVEIGSFYQSFPELVSPNSNGNKPSASVKVIDNKGQLNQRADNSFFSRRGPSKSPTSSCSQNSGSAISNSSDAKQHTIRSSLNDDNGVLMTDDPVKVLNRAFGEAEVHTLNQGGPKVLRSQSPPSSLEQLERHGGALRVKVTFGEEKIRFRLQPTWGFKKVQREIASRFNLDDLSRIDVKYLDDDGEWVLLTCDADLEECKEVYRTSPNQTIRLSLQWVPHQSLGGQHIW